MDLKIGKDKRIRITKTEYQELQEKGLLSEFFVLTSSIQFSLEIGVDRSNSKSTATSVPDGILLTISSKDFENLNSAVTSKKGISVGGFLLQVDLWDAERRA